MFLDEEVEAEDVIVPCEIWVVFMRIWEVTSSKSVIVPCEIWVVFMLKVRG